jgi:hypothetical protein
MHLLLPHSPWRYLPSGAEYDFTGMDGWSRDETWNDSPWLVRQGYQRHLLQTSYADALIGRLVRRLRQVGLYDRALLVVVADHGVSFTAGGSRRRVQPETFADIANVPMFVKYPNQKRGSVDRRPARTLDLMPTVADVLTVDVPWRTDGRSLLETLPERKLLRVRQTTGQSVSASLDAVEKGRRATIRQKAALLGEGAGAPFQLGSNSALLGTRTPSPARQSSTVRVAIEDAFKFRDVRKGSGFVPARISAVVEKGRVAAGVEIAVAVNGRVRALTQCFLEGTRQRFRAIVPESVFNDGFNRVDVYAVRARGSGYKLVWLGTSANHL